MYGVAFAIRCPYTPTYALQLPPLPPLLLLLLCVNVFGVSLPPY